MPPSRLPARYLTYPEIYEMPGPRHLRGALEVAAEGEGAPIPEVMVTLVVATRKSLPSFAC
jgi:hypothetical protein